MDDKFYYGAFLELQDIKEWVIKNQFDLTLEITPALIKETEEQFRIFERPSAINSKELLNIVKRVIKVLSKHSKSSNAEN